MAGVPALVPANCYLQPATPAGNAILASCVNVSMTARVLVIVCSLALFPLHGVTINQACRFQITEKGPKR
uniref:Uncharacterized protein n=1 Tax=Oryza barthii TaxID=65489 RepID=A0A0D3FB66_9ORYZ